MPCPAGQFVTDNRLCQNCPIGTYRTGLAGENCQQCPDGLHTLESGAMDESQCSVSKYITVHSAVLQIRDNLHISP